MELGLVQEERMRQALAVVAAGWCVIAPVWSAETPVQTIARRAEVPLVPAEIRVSAGPLSLLDILRDVDRTAMRTMAFEQALNRAAPDAAKAARLAVATVRY